eukprot:scaffold89047_cov55-Phaeocystis_antarctica.AAC.3
MASGCRVPRSDGPDQRLQNRPKTNRSLSYGVERDREKRKRRRGRGEVEPRESSLAFHPPYLSTTCLKTTAPLYAILHTSVPAARATMSWHGQAEQPMMPRGQSVCAGVPDSQGPSP